MHLGICDHGKWEAGDDDGPASAVREVEPLADLPPAHRKEDGPARRRVFQLRPVVVCRRLKLLTPLQHVNSSTGLI